MDGSLQVLWGFVGLFKTKFATNVAILTTAPFIGQLAVAPPPPYGEIGQSQLRSRHSSNEPVAAQYDVQNAGIPHQPRQHPYRSNFAGVGSPNGSDVTSQGGNMDEGFENFQTGIDQSVLENLATLPDKAPREYHGSVGRGCESRVG